MDKNVNYVYRDGSGNSYIFQETSGQINFEYVPVKKEFSSSGEYSGGESIKKSITKNQFDEIKKLLEKSIRNKKIHIQNRVMMSGMIIIENGKNKITFIISPDSIEKTQIEEKLKKIKHAI